MAEQGETMPVAIARTRRPLFGVRAASAGVDEFIFAGFLQVPRCTWRAVTCDLDMPL
jgi:hypothetical protein